MVSQYFSSINLTSIQRLAQHRRSYIWALFYIQIQAITRIFTTRLLIGQEALIVKLAAQQVEVVGRFHYQKVVKVL